MDYILKNQGPRQKVQVIEDGARTLYYGKIELGSGAHKTANTITPM